MFETSAKDGVPQGKVIHVSWEVSAALPCLAAPVTEIRKVKAREGVTLEAVQAALDNYVNKLRTEAVGATYGQVIKNPEEIVLVIGWKTIEVWTCSWVKGQRLKRQMVGAERWPGREGDKGDNRGGGDQRLVEAV
jgi:hypothetical protein